MSFQLGHFVEPVCLESSAGVIRPSFVHLCSARSICSSSTQTLPDSLMLRGDDADAGDMPANKKPQKKLGKQDSMWATWSDFPGRWTGSSSGGLLLPYVRQWCITQITNILLAPSSPTYCTALSSATKPQSIQLLLFIYLFIWGWTLVQLKTKNKFA